MVLKSEKQKKKNHFNTCTQQVKTSVHAHRFNFKASHYIDSTYQLMATLLFYHSSMHLLKTSSSGYYFIATTIDKLISYRYFQCVTPQRRVFTSKVNGSFQSHYITKKRTFILLNLSYLNSTVNITIKYKKQ